MKLIKKESYLDQNVVIHHVYNDEPYLLVIDTVEGKDYSFVTVFKMKQNCLYSVQVGKVLVSATEYFALRKNSTRILDNVVAICLETELTK